MALLEDLPRYFDYVAEYERARADAGMVASADTLNEGGGLLRYDRRCAGGLPAGHRVCRPSGGAGLAGGGGPGALGAQNQELVCGPVAEASPVPGGVRPGTGRSGAANPRAWPPARRTAPTITSC